MAKSKKLRQKYRALCFKNTVIMKTLDRNHNKKLEEKLGKVYDTRNNKMDTRLKNSNPKLPCLRPKHDVISTKPNGKATDHADKVQNSRKKGNTHHQKGFNKRRQEALVRDLNCFKKSMKEESFVKNPHAMVMNQTMSKLSSEYFENL